MNASDRGPQIARSLSLKELCPPGVSVYVLSNFVGDLKIKAREPFPIASNLLSPLKHKPVPVPVLETGTEKPELPVLETRTTGVRPETRTTI